MLGGLLPPTKQLLSADAGFALPSHQKVYRRQAIFYYAPVTAPEEALEQVILGFLLWLTRPYLHHNAAGSRILLFRLRSA